jgi:hypothetical protein
MQMAKIADKIERQAALGLNVIFTGDLNQIEAEIAEHSVNLRRDPKAHGVATWGGDAWSAKVENKMASQPLVLDYAFIAGKAVAIETKVIEDPHYKSEEYSPDARSDHRLLFSTVSLGATEALADSAHP